MTQNLNTFNIGDHWIVQKSDYINKIEYNQIIIINLKIKKFSGEIYQHIKAFNLTNNEKFSIFYNQNLNEKLEFLYCDYEGKPLTNDVKHFKFIEKINK